MYVISMFSFRYIYQNPELCQVLVSHFGTFTEDSTALGSQSSRIVVQRLEKKILHYAGKHGEFCVLECAQEQDLCVHRNRTCVCTGT